MGTYNTPDTVVRDRIRTKHRAWDKYAAVAAVKLKELELASASFDRALQLARSQEDRAAENAIRRAIDDINSTVARRALHAAGTDSDQTSGHTSRGTTYVIVTSVNK